MLHRSRYLILLVKLISTVDVTPIQILAQVGSSVSNSALGGASLISFVTAAPTARPNFDTPGVSCQGFGMSRGKCKRRSRQFASTVGFPGCFYFKTQNPFYIRKYRRKQCKKMGEQSKAGCKALNNMRCPGGEGDVTCFNKRLGCQIAATCPYKLKKECDLFPTACQWVAGLKKVHYRGCQPL